MGRERCGESGKEERKMEERNAEGSFSQTVEEIRLRSEKEVCRRGGGEKETEEIEARWGRGEGRSRGGKGLHQLVEEFICAR